MFAVLPAWHRYVPASPGLTDDTTILVCDSPASLSDSSETPRLKSAETSLPPPDDLSRTWDQDSLDGGRRRLVTEHSRTRVSPMLTDKSLGPWMVVSTRPEMKIFLLHERFLKVIFQYFDSYTAQLPLGWRAWLIWGTIELWTCREELSSCSSLATASSAFGEPWKLSPDGVSDVVGGQPLAEKRGCDDGEVGASGLKGFGAGRNLRRPASETPLATTLRWTLLLTLGSVFTWQSYQPPSLKFIWLIWNEWVVKLVTYLY